MTSEPTIFNLRLSTIPLWNARIEFNRAVATLKKEDFRAQIEAYSYARKPEPIHAYHIIWGGSPDGLLTWFLQRAIIGVEAYLPSALWVASWHYSRVSEEINRASKDSFDIDDRRTSTADRIYNKLPALLNKDFQLNRANGTLWKSVREFYESVRNPLFHSQQLEAESNKDLELLDAVLKAFDMFTEVYEWIDWWCPQRFTQFQGSAPLTVSEMPKLPNDHPVRKKVD